MPENHSSYLLEIPYPPQFHREHSPLWFKAVAAALGRPHRTCTDWCEVGCGPAVGLLILAATNPAVTFHGIDLNPGHIEQARALADEAGITNTVFHCIDLRDAETLPDFDHIVVRGIYSWVAQDMRRAIGRFIANRLKPDGMALLHYLALPGSADLMAVHGLFHAIYRETGLPVREAIRAGQDMLAKLHAGKAGFFATHPVADLKAGEIIAENVDYTAHDFLNAHYAPLHVAAVIDAMHEHGLAFAGSANPEDNLDDFSVPSALRDLFEAQKTIALRETVRDMASNQFSRVDLYMRDTSPLAAHDHIAALQKLSFRALPGLPRTGHDIGFSTRIGQVEGPKEVFSPIVATFARGGSVPYAEIEALPAFAGNPGIVNRALHALMGADAIHPAPPEDNAPDSGPARRLNAALLARHKAGCFMPALAAPAIASGVAVDAADLDALSRGGTPRTRLLDLLP